MYFQSFNLALLFLLLICSQNNLTPGEGADYANHSESPKQVESLSSDVIVPASSVAEFCESTETDSGNQHSSVHMSDGFNFGLMPPTLGNPLGSMEASDNQAHDAARASSVFVSVFFSVDLFLTQDHCFWIFLSDGCFVN